jgi:hypothetical protein
MKFDEIKKKDWQLLMAYSAIQNLAYSKTIMETQAEILASIKETSAANEMSKITAKFNKNYQIFIESIRKDIPDYD